MITFPQGFTWGVATSSYQIEGAHRQGGKGESVWDTFSHTPGKVKDDHNGDVACDHVHRYAEDVALVRELGVSAYRFSVSWPRLFPTGRGRPNPQGRDHYDRLIDTLLKANITPWLCPYHWDHPQALQDKGGWTSRDMVHWFTDYALYLAEQYGDRVSHMPILNEPASVALLGHLLGQHAPGLSDISAYAAATHHLNLAQGTALRALKEAKPGLTLGTILSLQPMHPRGDNAADEEAAALFDIFANRNCVEPLFKGHYPERSQMLFETVTQDGDMDIIRAPLDFLGVNYYTRFLVEADRGSLIGIRQAPPPEGAARTAMGWEVYPDGLLEVLLALKERYDNPTVFVTENGAAFDDTPDAHGGVDDPKRIRYLAQHVDVVRRALEQGVNVRGYFVWSLLDNFEWQDGFHKRFGLVRVDFETQTRTPKASYAWYQQLIREGGLTRGED